MMFLPPINIKSPSYLPYFQPSLSLDYSSVETILLKNEGDFISVEQGKELSRKKKQQQREDNMRQLLDVTNTLTTEEIKDFEMRWVNLHFSIVAYSYIIVRGVAHGVWNYRWDTATTASVGHFVEIRQRANPLGDDLQILSHLCAGTLRGSFLENFRPHDALDPVQIQRHEPRISHRITPD